MFTEQYPPWSLEMRSIEKVSLEVILFYCVYRFHRIKKNNILRKLLWCLHQRSYILYNSWKEIVSSWNCVSWKSPISSTSHLSGSHSSNFRNDAVVGYNHVNVSVVHRFLNRHVIYISLQGLIYQSELLGYFYSLIPNRFLYTAVMLYLSLFSCLCLLWKEKRAA